MLVNMQYTFRTFKAKLLETKKFRVFRVRQANFDYIRNFNLELYQF